MKKVDKDLELAGKEVAKLVSEGEMLKNVENGNGVKFTDTRGKDSPEAKATEMDVKFEKEKLKRKEEVEADRLKGFDIDSLESIRNFEIAYTPVGNTVLVKYVLEELKIGSVWIPDKSNTNLKAIVVVPGIYVNNLLLGDVVTIRGSTTSNPYPPSMERIFRGVTFQEISYEAVAGVFKTRNEIIERIANESKKLKAEEGNA